MSTQPQESRRELLQQEDHSDVEVPLLPREERRDLHLDTDKGVFSEENYSANGEVSTASYTDIEQPSTPTHLRTLRGCSFRGGVANLVVTAVGAGMLAMPKAFATVGIMLGIVEAGIAATLTILSAYIIVSLASNAGSRSYEDLVRSSFGNRGARVLSTSIVLHVFGVMVVYLMIIADQLVGRAPSYEGLLPTLLGMPGGEGLLSRAAVTGSLLICVVAPLLISRSLAFLSRFSRASVILLLCIASLLLGLAALALFKGKAATDVHILPPIIRSWHEGLEFWSSALGVLAVNALAFTLHFNLIPVHLSLRNNSKETMLEVTRCAVGIAGTLYVSVALAGYALYGSDADGDILKNLTITSVSGLIPRKMSALIMTFIVAAMTINLLINFVLKVWAVREALCELVLARKSLELTRYAYYVLTSVLVLAAYIASIVVPSVWFLVSLVGSTACVTFALVVPGLLLYHHSENNRHNRLTGMLMVALATVMAITAIYNALKGRSDV